MNRIAFVFVALLLTSCVSHQPARPPAAPVYPATTRTDQVDDYHGTRVADPYRWLEDDNSAQTKAWVEAQNRVTFAFLDQIPQRAAIKRRLTTLWDFERYGVPFKEGGRYFLTRNNGLQNQSVLYTLASLDAEPRVLLDPNQLSADGTAALSGYAVSDDGKLIAYGISSAGSDWQEWKVRDIDTGVDRADMVKWVKFSHASWTADNKGFFYSRYDEPAQTNTLKGVNYFQKLCYHRLGTPQSEDPLIYHRPDHKDWGFAGEVTEDDHYLIISVSQGTDVKNRVFYKELQKSDAPVVELLNEFDASYSFIGNVESTFYFHTDLNAPRGRIVAIDITRPARDQWREIVPQSPDRLQGASLVNDQFIVAYLRDAQSAIKVVARDGRLVRQVELPGIGSAVGFGGRREYTETFYAFTSFITPMTIYRYDLQTGTSTVFRKPKVDFKPARYETKQVFYTSKDGTRIPMFITHRKGLKLDGDRPTLLFGYGGFDISLTPSFSVPAAVWLEMGGVYALPSLRGGGEYGEDWHRAGMKDRKQNVFDDFLGAAEWLVAQRYTRPARLAIYGGSNGGLLVGACMTQRPELFGAALPAVGVLDMLRFHKFTIGWAWTSEYGSADNAEDFRWLYAYSPLHNLRLNTCYPATLIITADHDDRVVPAHSFKFAATLQSAQGCHNPVLIRIETRAGHGAGKPTTKLIAEAADRWAFLVRALKMNVQW